MRLTFLACYAPHAVKGLIAGSDRKAAINALLGSVGGKLESLMFTRGEFDIALVAEVPNRDDGMGLMMAIQSSGLSPGSVKARWAGLPALACDAGIAG